MTSDRHRSVEQLLARQRIDDLLAHYCDRLDAYDIAAVARCFTVDGVTDYGPGRGGEVVGRAAIEERIRSGQAAFRRTHHQLGHRTVTFDNGDLHQASAVTAALTWHERWNGDRELLALRYVDRLAHVNGQWLLARRRVEVSIVEGFDGTAWHWWPRLTPQDSATRPDGTG